MERSKKGPIPEGRAWCPDGHTEGWGHTGTSCPTGDTDRDKGGSTALTQVSSGMRMTSLGHAGGSPRGASVVVGRDNEQEALCCTAQSR